MFLALYFMAYAFKEDKTKKAALFGLLAGISTAIMGLFWGGVTFMFVAVALTFFILFLLNEIKKKDIAAYSAWVIGFTAFFAFSGGRYSLIGLLTSITTAFSYFVFALLIFDYVLFKTKFSEKIKIIKLPDRMLSLILLVIIAFIFLIIISPSFISHAAEDISNYLFKPFATSRWITTVAENNRPFFDAWKSSFGLTFFWIMILGSVILFYEMAGKIKLKERVIFTGAYLLMILGIIFSRYSGSSIMNGSSTISLIFFIGSMIIFAGVSLLIYLKKDAELEFNKNIVLMTVIFFFSVFSARSAIRLFYFIYPIAPIMASFAIIRISEIALKNKDDLLRVILLAAALFVIGTSLYSAYGIRTAFPYSLVITKDSPVSTLPKRLSKSF